MASTPRGEQEEAVLRVAGGSDRLEILRAEYRRHCFTPHFHETFAVGLVDRGAVTIGYRGATHALRPGAVLVIEPGEVHAAQSADGGAWSYRSLYPPPALLADAAGGEVPFFGGGVYAVVRRERTGLSFQSNAAFVVGDSEVVVVDAQFSQGATREVLAARPDLLKFFHERLAAGTSVGGGPITRASPATRSCAAWCSTTTSPRPAWPPRTARPGPPGTPDGRGTFRSGGCTPA